MSKQPWASGPGEILQHGLSLLKKDSDKNRRLALLSIDNAVELTLKTYLNLPKRVTSINLSRKDYAEISESFPRLLDAIEQHAADKISGIDLGEIEWYHRLRNELYHQGNGLTVERHKAEVYAELAKLLYKNLFGIDIEVEEMEGQELIGKLLAAWVQLEERTWVVLDGFRGKVAFKSKPFNAFRKLVELNLIDSTMLQEIDTLRKLRNGVVHGDEESIKQLSPIHIERINTVLSAFEQITASN